MRWHILTGEYPPQEGGVAGYTQLVARALAMAGDAVDVWVPGQHAEEPEPRVALHHLPDHFGPRALSALTLGFRRDRGPYRLLVQYVPHAFGWKGANIPFCLWLRAQARDATWVMFHEVAYPVNRQQRLSHNGLGLVTRGMAALAASAASRAFVSIPAWEPMVRRAAAASTSIEWMPVPSVIPVAADAQSVAALRARIAGGRPLIGHFGTYGRLIRPLLADAVRELASVAPSAHVLLVGRGSEHAVAELDERVPGLRGRLHATGTLDAQGVSHHVAACDVMLQPYPDGITTRRTSAMVALAHGRPLVTTAGDLTEHLWHQGSVVLCGVGDAPALARACAAVVGAPADAARLGSAGRALYESRFDLRHTINLLRQRDPHAADLREAS